MWKLTIYFVFLIYFLHITEADLIGQCKKLRASKDHSDEVFAFKCNNLRSIILRKLVSMLQGFGAEVKYEDYCIRLRDNKKRVEAILSEYCRIERSQRESGECGKGSKFIQCTSPCPRSCDSIGSQTEGVCDEECIDDCECSNGFVWSGKPFITECIPQNECHNNDLANIEKEIERKTMKLLEEEGLSVGVNSNVEENDLFRLASRLENRLNKISMDRRLKRMKENYMKNIMVLKENLEYDRTKVGPENERSEMDNEILKERMGRSPELNSQCNRLLEAKRTSDANYKHKCERNNYETIRHKVEMYFKNQGAKLLVNTFCNILRTNMDKAEQIMDVYCKIETHKPMVIDDLFTRVLDEIIFDESIKINHNMEIGLNNNEVDFIISVIEKKLSQAKGPSLKNKLKFIIDDMTEIENKNNFNYKYDEVDDYEYDYKSHELFDEDQVTGYDFIKAEAKRLQILVSQKSKRLRGKGKTLLALFLEISEKSMEHIRRRLEKIVMMNPSSDLVPFLMRRLEKAIRRLKKSMKRVHDAGY